MSWSTVPGPQTWSHCFSATDRVQFTGRCCQFLAKHSFHELRRGGDVGHAGDCGAPSGNRLMTSRRPAEARAIKGECEAILIPVVPRAWRHAPSPSPSPAAVRKLSPTDDGLPGCRWRRCTTPPGCVVTDGCQRIGVETDHRGHPTRILFTRLLHVHAPARNPDGKSITRRNERTMSVMTVGSTLCPASASRSQRFQCRGYGP